ncbi:class I SAM-dependent methyltransferase [Alteromonas sp. BL110]|uniref:class I SAM-dependent methyltransferase n=1 Tax=Alteromonas sp. BL110 TaxID=1714845 RepID=UPI000E4FD331|nr:class I SAM-dependent methyltransferase [Alteromonas sp. BL110]AXT38526.1 class I SAM-dependent methyltransferase [Alteromonas sp. BL110]RKM83325.1 methyltransferase domain-containing protein [Alteromonas sp. BL110]
MSCPLCQSANTSSHYHTDKKREYLQCSQCDLVYVSPEFLPSKEIEKQEYDLHENSFEDEGYRKFLGKVLTPLSPLIKATNAKALSGLDFGCGPAPVLASMLSEDGVNMSTYDPFYAPTLKALEKRYDIVTCTEAIEHFHAPHMEWALFNKLVASGGVLAIMTKRVLDKARFANWHYKNDVTHVSFFSEATFQYLAQRDGYDVSFPANDVVLMKKR